MFNHPNYQRFATTHFIDLHFVEKASPEMLKLLIEAVYSVNKSGRRLSLMPTDQNHEQVNKDLKGSGRISDLLNTTGSLERFLVSGPIVSQLINDFEGSDKVIDMTLNHHSVSKALQKRFSEDKDKLIKEFVQTGNPFIGYKDIISLESAAQIFTKLKNWTIPASRISSKKYLLTINSRCLTQSSTTTVKDTTKVLAKKSSDILTNMFIAA